MSKSTEDTVLSWLDYDPEVGEPHVQIEDEDTPISELTREDLEESVERGDAYNLYVRWCAKFDLEPLGKNTFYNRLRQDPRIGKEVIISHGRRVFPHLYPLVLSSHAGPGA